MYYSFFSACIVLFLVLDPLGNIPMFISQLHGIKKNRKFYIITREVLIAFTILLLFMLAGKKFLQLLQLSELSMQLAGSIIMFLISLNMIFPPLNHQEKISQEEPFIVPLAIPLLAGPSAIASVMLLASNAPQNISLWIWALALVMLICAIILLLAEYIQNIVGSKVVVAFERLMGLILVAMSVEMFLKGIKTFISSLT